MFVRIPSKDHPKSPASLIPLTENTAGSARKKRGSFRIESATPPPTFIMCAPRSQVLPGCSTFTVYPAPPVFKYESSAQCTTFETAFKVEAGPPSPKHHRSMLPLSFGRPTPRQVMPDMNNVSNGRDRPAPVVLPLQVHHPKPQVAIPKPTVRSLEDSLAASSLQSPITEQLEALPIESPGLAAARAYYRNLETPPSSGPWAPGKNFSEPQAGVPRRHSTVVDNHLKQQVPDWNLRSAPGSRRGSRMEYTNPAGPRNTLVDTRIKIERGTKPSVSPSSSTNAILESKLPSTSQHILNPLDPHVLGNVPASFTTAKLREWGDVYLGNTITADAFVRAVPIPRSRVPRTRPQSFPPVLSPPTSPNGIRQAANGTNEEVQPRRASSHDTPANAGGPAPPTRGLLNVRIVPKAKDRKAFFMAKRFPLMRRTHGRVSKEGSGSSSSSSSSGGRQQQALRTDAIVRAVGWPDNQLANYPAWKVHVPAGKELPIRMTSLSETAAILYVHKRANACKMSNTRSTVPLSLRPSC